MNIDQNGGFINISNIPFDLDDGIGARARIGLIVLASDHTIEHEFREIVTMTDVAFYESRIPNSPKITPETLRSMGRDIYDCAAVILPGVEFDVIAYGCTSASIVLGEEQVFEKLQAARPEAIPTTPITAAFAAFDALNIKRLGVLTPYRNDINVIMKNYIEKKGFQVPVFGSFNEENDNRAARITTDSIRRAVLKLGAYDEVDGVFISCTSLRLANIVQAIEEELGKPVTSSNHAIIWHSLRLAGIKDQINDYGALYRLAL
ncbi:MAG: Asp/Glu racemase [Acidiferrobacteraceae bacterium]|nr:Asp/Glu racemase [Acidiferrobacteraceae bacterium]